MFWLFGLPALFFLGRGATSRNQRQQIAIAQQQAVMQEDLLAITAAPVEQRAAILQGRIEGRRRAVRAKVIAGLCFWGVIAGFILMLAHNSDNATPTQAAEAATTAPDTASFDAGKAGRQTWEVWFARTAGPYRAGASWWAAHRSLANASCTALRDPASLVGCRDAKAVMDPFDARRRADPDYRTGWNSVSPPATPVQSTTGVRMPAQEVRAALSEACRQLVMSTYPVGYYDAGQPGAGQDPLANLINLYQTRMPACLNADNGFSTPYSDSAARKALGVS